MNRRVIVRAVLAGAGAGLVSWAVVGVQGARPLLIGVCVLAGVAALLSAPAGWYGSWPVRPHTATGGGSGQIWRLANRLRTLDDRRGSDPALQYRLRRLATARLRRLGVAWDDPRSERALGPDVHAALGGDDFRPTLRDVERIVAAVERLGHLGRLDEPDPHRATPGGAGP